MRMIRSDSPSDALLAGMRVRARTRRSPAIRRTTLAATIVASVTVLVGLIGGAAASVAAQASREVSGLVEVTASSEVDSRDSKSAVAQCPAGKSVVGGGAMAHSAGVGQDRLALVSVRPSSNVDGRGTDGYVGAAAEVSPHAPGEWWVDAYAMCADASSLDDWHIVTNSTDLTSEAVQRIAAVCPSGQRVLGSGARIATLVPGEGDVVLHAARASAPGDIVRAQGHEDADGFSGQWRLTAYAICARPPAGYHIVTSESPSRDSEPFKQAVAFCGLRKLLSGGAAVSSLAPGNISLDRIILLGPIGSPNHLQVQAWENIPTSHDWDFIVARAICVDGT